MSFSSRAFSLLVKWSNRSWGGEGERERERIGGSKKERKDKKKKRDRECRWERKGGKKEDKFADFGNKQ